MKILIIGCGRLGAGLAQALSLRSHQVTIIDKDATAFDRLLPSFAGQQLDGAGFDRGLLLRAGIERADGLAAVTGSDEVNAVVARVAREVFKVPRVVARLDDPRKAEIYRRLGLQTIAPVTWGISRIADLLCYTPLAPVVSLGTGEVDIVEAEATPLLVGRMVADVTLPGEIHVVAITRRGSTLLPTMGTVFQIGDQLHLAVLGISMERLNVLLGAA